MGEVLKNIELIENYVEGKLSAQDMQDFETKLLIDSDFKEEFNLYKNVAAGIKSSGEENLKAKLKAVDIDLDSNNIITISPENKKSNRFYYSIAASVILVIGITFMWNFNTRNNLSDLADSVYEKDKGMPVEMTINGSEYSEMLNKYKTGDYNGAKNLLMNIHISQINNDTISYYLGLVNYELKDYNVAKNNLTSIQKTSSFYFKSEYRMLLVYLKLDSTEQAKKTYKQILANTNHPYFDKAQLVSKELFSEDKK